MTHLSWFDNYHMVITITDNIKLNSRDESSRSSEYRF